MSSWVPLIHYHKIDLCNHTGAYVSLKAQAVLRGLCVHRQCHSVIRKTVY
jgi:hypothetical protein